MKIVPALGHRGSTKRPAPRAKSATIQVMNPRTITCPKRSTGYGSKPDCHWFIGGSHLGAHSTTMT